jgi:hypothetical protein
MLPEDSEGVRMLWESHKDKNWGTKNSYYDLQIVNFACLVRQETKGEGELRTGRRRRRRRKSRGRLVTNFHRVLNILHHKDPEILHSLLYEVPPQR